MNAKQLHRKSMDLVQDAIVAHETGRGELAEKLYLEAFGFESRAAELLQDDFDNEPTRSIIFKSAANLALECGKIREAEQLVTAALSGAPQEREAEELRDLYENINLARHLRLKGVDLGMSELQMSLSGQEVGFGLINSDEFIKRFQKFETLIIRTVERKSGKPFRKSGRPPAKIKSVFQPFLSVPRAASFAITIRIGKVDDVQIDMFRGSEIEEVINDVVFGLMLVDEGSQETLKELISEEVYYNNFISLAKEIAPDGKRISLVGFTYKHKGNELSFGMTKIKSNFELAETDDNTDSEIEYLEGKLRIADGVKNRITIVGTDTVSYSIIVPEGLNDIVRDYWDENVVVTLSRKKNKLHLLDISSLEE